jgi:hypothetical protein
MPPPPGGRSWLMIYLNRIHHKNKKLPCIVVYDLGPCLKNMVERMQGVDQPGFNVTKLIFFSTEAAVKIS